MHRLPRKIQPMSLIHLRRVSRRILTPATRPALGLPPPGPEPIVEAVVTSVCTRPFGAQLSPPACNEPSPLPRLRPPASSSTPSLPSPPLRSNHAMAIPRTAGKPPGLETTPPGDTLGPERQMLKVELYILTPADSNPSPRIALPASCDAGRYVTPPRADYTRKGRPTNPSPPLQAQPRRKREDLTMTGVHFKISSSGIGDGGGLPYVAGP